MTTEHGNASLKIILQPEIQSILDNFAALLRIHVVFFSATGEILLQGRGEGNCRYCRIVQERFGLETCVALDHAKLAQAEQSDECLVYQCHGGLCEAVIPLRISEKLLGFVMFGQFRRKGDKPVLSDTATAKQAFRNCPVFTPESMRYLSGMLAMLVDYLVRNELVRCGDEYLYFELKQYIDQHYRQSLRIADAAKYLGRSVSSLSHYLQKSCDHTFRQLLIERRIRHVEDGLKSNQHHNIKQLALEAGFNDPCYFSRIYRRYRDMTITEFASRNE